MHKPNEMSVTELETWLRDHPDADSTARLEMIRRLREAKEKLTIKKQDNETTTTEIQ